MGRRGVLLDAELMLVVVFDQEIVAVFVYEEIEVQHRRLLRLALESPMLTSGLKDCGATPSLQSQRLCPPPPPIFDFPSASLAAMLHSF